MRDAAYRSGLPRFLRWWTSELAAIAPAASRRAVARRRLRPVVEFADSQVAFWRPEQHEGQMRLGEVGRLPLTGDAADLAARASALLASFPRSSTGASGPRVVIALSPRQVLRKRMTLPAALEENLTQALAFDLDRHTPFRPEQVYFDAVVTDRDAARKTITVDWAAALKTVVDEARKQVQSWGAVPVAVTPGPVQGRASAINLIPDAERTQRKLLRRWDIWVPISVLAVLALAVVAVPLAQKREYTIALAQQTETARQQAAAADALRQQLEALQNDYNFVLARKYAFPSAVQVLEDVTRLMPDDTWITQLEVKTSGKGKEVQRDMLLRGESGNAGKLIGPLEDSKLVQQAAPRSPTTKIQPGPGEVFDLGAQLRPLPPPAPLPLTPAAAADASGAGGPSAPAGPGSPSPAPTSGASAASGNAPAATPAQGLAQAAPPSGAPQPLSAKNAAPGAH